jgi:glycosyltransferase involved in cell wall biosynthesis
MRILHLLPSLQYNGAAKQALLLGPELSKVCDLRVCVLHEEGPWANDLRGAGVAVHALTWARPIDPLPLWRLHKLLRAFQPDRIHLWRLPALRALALVGRGLLPRCIVSQALPADRLGPRLGKLDRWLLRRVDRIVAGGETEAQHLQQLGLVGPERVAVVPPGATLNSRVPARGGPGRSIVCLGNLEPHKGFREALRAADYLSYPFADLHLHVIGAGSVFRSLKRFQEACYHQDHLHLLGPCADAADRLARADVCWVPSLTSTGQQVALEAMAAARPVVASDVPALREIISEGESGLLCAPGDKTALASCTRRLLLDEPLRRRLGEAAQRRVRDRFAAAAFVAGCRRLYGV